MIYLTQLDPNQLKAIEDFLSQSTVSLLLNPSAKTLGESLQAVTGWLCRPLLKLGIINKQKLALFEQEIVDSNKQIPEQHRSREKIGLTIKAIEEAKYQLDDDDIRHMFVHLISSTVDDRKNNLVSPRLATVVSQFGPKEAELVQELHHTDTHIIVSSQMWANEGDSDFWITPRFIISPSFGITDGLSSSIDTLKSLGVINIRLDRHLTEKNYVEQYAKLEQFIEETQTNTKLYKSIKFKNGYIELSSFGKDLVRCIWQ